MLEDKDRGRIVSRYHRTVAYSYPIPTLGRDRVLAILQPDLWKNRFTLAAVLALGATKSAIWTILS